MSMNPENPEKTMAEVIAQYKELGRMVKTIAQKRVEEINSSELADIIQICGSNDINSWSSALGPDKSNKVLAVLNRARSFLETIESAGKLSSGHEAAKALLEDLSENWNN